MVISSFAVLEPGAVVLFYFFCLGSVRLLVSMVERLPCWKMLGHCLCEFSFCLPLRLDDTRMKSLPCVLSTLFLLFYVFHPFVPLFFVLEFFIFFLFFIFCLFVVVAISWAAPVAYGGSQARG